MISVLETVFMQNNQYLTLEHQGRGRFLQTRKIYSSNPGHFDFFSGSESRLEDCDFPGWAIVDCSHSEDAGVICGKQGSHLLNYDFRQFGKLIIQSYLTQT